MNTANRSHRPALPRRSRITAGTLLRSAVPAIAAIALAGCSVLGSGGTSPRATIYAPDVRVQADPAWPSVQWQLAIGGASASRMIDSPRINVRPTPAELQVYAGASWAQPSTDMIEDTLLRAFEDSGRIDAVARSDTGIRADYKLVLDLRRFESDYAGRAMPDATIEIAAKLLYNRDQRVAASRTFLQAAPAASTEIDDVVAAFEQSLTAITHDIVGWTLTSGEADAAAAQRP